MKKNFVNDVLNAVNDMLIEHIQEIKDITKTHYDESEEMLGEALLLSEDKPSIKKHIPTKFSIEDLEGYGFQISIEVNSALEEEILRKQYTGTGQDGEITTPIMNFFEVPKDERKGKYFNPEPKDTKFVNDLREKINGKPEMP